MATCHRGEVSKFSVKSQIVFLPLQAIQSLLKLDNSTVVSWKPPQTTNKLQCGWVPTTLSLQQGRRDEFVVHGSLPEDTGHFTSGMDVGGAISFWLLRLKSWDYLKCLFLLYISYVISHQYYWFYLLNLFFCHLLQGLFWWSLLKHVRPFYSHLIALCISRRAQVTAWNYLIYLFTCLLFISHTEMETPGERDFVSLLSCCRMLPGTRHVLRKYLLKEKGPWTPPAFNFPHYSFHPSHEIWICWISQGPIEKRWHA